MNPTAGYHNLCLFGYQIIEQEFELTDLVEKGEKGEVKDKKEKPKGINVLYTILFTLAYFFLMRPLGFILTTAIAIVAFSFLMKSRERVVVIIVAVLLPIALHLLFVSLLKVSLPQGIVESILQF